MTINAISIIPCKTASCDAMGNVAYKKKMNKTWAEKRRGDIVQYDFNKNGTSDHTGILESINADGSITVIEGNTSVKSNDNGGCVMRRRRYRNQVNYFIRPNYNKEVTADMVLATARAELGVKEKPTNSNNVKYNTWFYGRKVSGSNYPWCEVFVCWCFSHVVTTAKPIPKPTSKYAKTIPSGTLRKGDKGDKVKALQEFLNWYGARKGTIDGIFGTNTMDSVKRFQQAESIEVDGIYGNVSYLRAKAYATNPAKKGYSGSFPDMVIHSRNYIQQVAKELAYPKGTAQKTYSYQNGKPKEAFTKAIKKVYGTVYYKWSKQCRMGASCDVFVGTVMRYSGCDPKWARGLSGQYGKTPAHTTQVNDIKAGDMLYYKQGKGGHTRIVVDIDGTLYNCEANHNKNGGQYGHIGSKSTKPKNVSYLHIFRVTSAFRSLQKGDKGSEVMKWEKFLKWCGYDLPVDGYFGDKTVSATKDFQSKHNLENDGIAGNKTIAKAKEIKR